ncbi:uncharacterized protein PAC_20154 [Phialocephala subalpina]|uniref:Uncharacterized protein n=1 Tax=Phialocephala subalpina TaxID=576137 RepID=A0A1L7XYV2_9HELO|nr:uncharacterized protein PAC_20154 [Phialocephala subalpina]
MCGGKADEAPAPASIPVELPTTGGERRPGTRNRPSTGDHRPKSHAHRPQSERRPRPGSSSARPSGTGDHGGRRTSSHRGHQHRERPKRDIEPIHEYPEDRVISGDVAELGAFIDAHVGEFYSPSNSGSTGRPQMDDRRLRQPAIRNFIIEKVIRSIILTNSPNIAQVAHELADDLRAYSNSNGKREEHLVSLCELGDNLRRSMQDHPASWTFGPLQQDGYIILVPALLRDEGEVIASQRFRIR